MNTPQDDPALLARFRAAALAANLGTWAWDIEHDRFDIDGNVERLIGQPRLKFKGRFDDFLALLPDEAQRQWRQSAASARGGSGLLYVEFGIRWPDGSARGLLARGTVTFDAAGKAQAAAGAIWDGSELLEARTTLASREAQLRASFSQSPTMQGMMTLDGTLTDVNIAALAATASRREDEVGRKFWDCSWWRHAPDTQAFARDLVARAASGQTVNEETDYFAVGGERRRTFILCSPVRNGAGDVTFLFVSGIDVTERRRAEAALAQSEARFRMRSDAAPQIQWISDGNGEIEYVNASGVRYFGAPLAELLGDGWAASLHPDDRAPTRAVWERHLHSGTPLDTQYRLRRHDGEYRWNLVRGVAQFDEDRRILKWYGTNTDIEDLRRAQDAAETATRAKSAFLSSMSHEIRTPMNAVIGMTSILMDTVLSAEQREAAEVIRSSGEHLLSVINDILDYSKIEAGKLDLENTAFSLRECVEGALDLVADGAARKNVELGYLIHVGTPETVLGDVGRLRQVLINLMSNAVKFTRADGQVMVEISVSKGPDGDPRQVLEFSVEDNGIGMEPEVMARLFRPFEQADNSTTRRFGGTGLGLSICKRLVELMGGDIEVSSVAGQGSTFSFSILAEPVAEPVMHRSAEVIPHLRGRRVLIVDDIEINRRILGHYVRNWGMVPLLSASAAEALGWIDRGDPFDLALLDYHMPDSDGLRLAHDLRGRRSAAVLPIVMLSSANVDTTERGVIDRALLKPIKPGRLLEAISDLFITAGRVEGPRVPAPELPRTQGAEHPLRLLVVEDNAVNQRVARLLLDRMGYGADFAGNGQEALDAVAQRLYDVVLMDVQMPVMDGISATRELCHRYPPSERPRIVGMTANATEEDRRDCQLAGMDDYLPKPVRPEALAAALRRCPRRADRTPEDFSEAGLTEMRRLYEDEGAAEIVAAMAQDLPGQCAQLEQGAAARDVKLFRRAAHSIKSAARMAGADDLGNLWERIERLSTEETLDDAAAMVAAAVSRQQRLLERLREALTA